ncbi:5-oxoprolinase subunit A [Streptomyces tendae]
MVTDEDAVVRRAVAFAVEGSVEAADGTTVAVAARSLCVHGDTPNAARIAARVREALENVRGRDRGVRMTDDGPTTHTGSLTARPAGRHALLVELPDAGRTAAWCRRTDGLCSSCTTTDDGRLSRRRRRPGARSGRGGPGRGRNAGALHARLTAGRPVAPGR